MPGKTAPVARAAASSSQPAKKSRRRTGDEGEAQRVDRKIAATRLDQKEQTSIDPRSFLSLFCFFFFFFIKTQTFSLEKFFLKREIRLQDCGKMEFASAIETSQRHARRRKREKDREDRFVVGA